MSTSHGLSVKCLPATGCQISFYLTRFDAPARFASVLVSSDSVATHGILEALQTWALWSTCFHAFLRSREIIFVSAATPVVKLLTFAGSLIVEPA